MTRAADLLRSVLDGLGELFISIGSASSTPNDLPAMSALPTQTSHGRRCRLEEPRRDGQREIGRKATQSAEAADGRSQADDGNSLSRWGPG